MIRQLCAGEEELPEEIASLYARYHPLNQEPGLEELLACLLAVVNFLPKEVYIIIDALDEFPEKTEDRTRQSLLDHIKRIVEHRSNNLHILATSRTEPDITAALESVATRVIPLRVPGVNKDINAFVHAQLEKVPFKNYDDKLKGYAQMQLENGANGMSVNQVSQLTGLESLY